MTTPTNPPLNLTDDEVQAIAEDIYAPVAGLPEVVRMGFDLEWVKSFVRLVEIEIDEQRGAA